MAGSFFPENLLLQVACQANNEIKIDASRYHVTTYVDTLRLG